MAIHGDLAILFSKPWKLIDHSKRAVKDIIVDGYPQQLPMQDLYFEIQACDDLGKPLVGFFLKDLGSAIVKHIVDCHNAQVSKAAEKMEEKSEEGKGMLFDTPSPKTPQQAAMQDLSIERLREELNL